MTPRTEITPLTRIGELLDCYPQLEEVLIDQAPLGDVVEQFLRESGLL